MEIVKYITILAGLFFVTSCAQVTPLHSARTNGSGNLSLTPAIDATGVQPGANGDIGLPVYPGIRAEFAYGLTDNLDIIASVHTALSIKTSLKYQIYGDNYSSFALAVMPGYEYQNSSAIASGLGGNNVEVQRLHLPIIFSIYGGGNIDYYLGPNVILQFDNSPQNTAFPGVSGGIEIGKRIKYNIGIGGFIPYTFNIGRSETLIQFGVSAKIPLISS